MNKKVSLHIRILLAIALPVFIYKAILYVKFIQPLNVMNQNGHSYITAFSPDGDTVCSGGGDNKVRCWSYSTKKSIYSLAGHDNEVIALNFSSDGSKIISSSGKKIVLWNLKKGSIEKIFTSSIQVWSLSLSANYDYFVSGGYDAERMGYCAEVWDVDLEKKLFNLGMGKNSCYSTSLSSGGLVAIGNALGSVSVWDARSGEIQNYFEKPAQKDVDFAVAFSPDGKLLASGGTYIKLWDTRTGKLLHVLRDPWSARAINFSSDSKFIITGSSGQDENIYIWDVVSGKNIKKEQWRGATITSVAFWPTDSLIAVSNGGQVQVWESLWSHLLRFK